jgi:branched-chain amino acid transport system substrate-binding protein
MPDTRQWMKMVSVGLLGAIVVLSGCAQRSVQPGDGSAKKAVKIGFVNPLTGDSATYGQMGKRALEIALEEINAKGGADGHNLAISYQDDAGDPKQSVSATLKFTEDKDTLVLIGSALSSNTLAMIPILDKAKLPDVVYSSSSPKLAGSSAYFFRMAVQDSEMGKIMAKWAVQTKKAQRIVSFHVNNDYGNLLGASFADGVLANGGKLAGDYTYLANDRDFQAILTQAKALNPDVIGLCSTYTDAALIVKQARAMGITAAFVAPASVNSAKFLEIAGPAAEGVVASVSFSGDNPDPKSQAFAKKFKEKYNLDADHYAALAYDVAYVIADAVARSSQAGDLSREGITKALKTAKVAGLTGTVTFDAKNEWVRDYLSIAVKDGKFQLQK